MTRSGTLDTVVALGGAVRRVRREQKLTQAQLAEKAGVSRLFVIELEAGHPRAELGKALSVFDALGIRAFDPLLGMDRDGRPAATAPDSGAEATAGVTDNSMRAVPYHSPFVVADTLAALRGPASGEVSLPNRLLWNPSRPFDLSDEKRLRSMIRIVLREARSQDDLSEYVDRGSLVRLWPRLGLPEAIRKAWEARFPELATTDAR